MIPFHAEARKARVGKDLLSTSWKNLARSAAARDFTMI
jgi:hypothetical protein